MVFFDSRRPLSTVLGEGGFGGLGGGFLEVFFDACEVGLAFFVEEGDDDGGGEADDEGGEEDIEGSQIFREGVHVQCAENFGRGELEEEDA